MVEDDEVGEKGTKWPRRASPVVRVGVIAVVVLASLAAVAACLPDLAPIPVDDAGEPSPVTPYSGCGDGVIETLDDGGDSGESCDPGDAQTTGCESCQVTCSSDAGAALDRTGHCYFLAESTSSYNAAVKACNARSGHLVTISNDAEAAFVSALAADAGHWIGLAVRADLGAYGPPAGVNEPGWPHSSGSTNLTCSGCYSVGADDAGSFESDPSNASDSGTRSCLVSDKGRWLQVPCEDSARSYATLCEREAVGQRAQYCGGPFCTTVPTTAFAKRYVIVLAAETADAASAFCTTSYAGGSLVVLDTRQEREELVREIVSLVDSPITVWIGLSKQAGTWTWDREPAHPRDSPWADDQPLAASTGRAFLRIDPSYFDTQLAQSDDDAGTEARRAFVCERPIE